jgi:phenol/toluene 2-monooxygenase (NADH) P2/A2
MTKIDEKARYVGLDLSNSDTTEAIIEAIEQDNENVKITRFPGYIKAEAINKLVINKDTVEEMLGEKWETEDLQLVVTSYYGFMGEWDDEQIIIQWENV